MKFCATSARLLSSWRCVISTCARAASACCCACCSRARYSVGSICASNWPALTASPSRTFRPCSSPATRVFSRAEWTARKVPETGSPRAISTSCTATRSLAANSTLLLTGAGGAARVLRFCSKRCPAQARPSTTAAVMAKPIKRERFIALVLRSPKLRPDRRSMAQWGVCG